MIYSSSMSLSSLFSFIFVWFCLFVFCLLSQVFTVLTVTVSDDVTDEAPDKF